MASHNEQTARLSLPASHSTSRFPSLRRPPSAHIDQSEGLPASTTLDTDTLSSYTVAVISDNLENLQSPAPLHHADERKAARIQMTRPFHGSIPSANTSTSSTVADVSSINDGPELISVVRPSVDAGAPWASNDDVVQNGAASEYHEKGGWAATMSHEVAGKREHESWCTCNSGKQPQELKTSTSQHDVEAQEQSIPQIRDTTEGMAGTAMVSTYRVDWDGPNDITNPKNWPSRQKWAATACIAAFTFISPLASSMVAPALGQISEEFGITNAYEAQIVLSIFVLAYAIGPMLLGPLSEMYGRVPIAQGANVLFLAFNTACGFAKSKEQLMAFRFLSGLGGSAPLAVGGGILGDMFKPEERGKAMGMYAMGPLLGPALGPVVGGWVAQKSTWRWMFWATSVTGLIILAASVVWFRETYAPVLLHQKAKAIRKQTGDDRYRSEAEGDIDQSILKKVSANLGRAFGMLFTQPIVQVMALYMGYSYGILYLMLSTYTTLFVTHYHESIGISGLNYISLGLGFFLGAPLCGKLGDNMYRKLKARNAQDQGKPEFRMPIVIPFSCLVPVGLLVYGWSAQTKTHWIVPNVGAFIFGIGTIAAFQCVATYLVDTYARYAASAIAAVTILRSLMGFGFPLFAPAMYRALDYGWGNTVLAGAALGLGVPVPILLWFFGERLRKHSSLAMSAKLPPGGRGPAPPSALQGTSGPNPDARFAFEFKNARHSYLDAAPGPVVRSGPLR